MASFLLIYRDQRSASVIIIEALSLAAAQMKAVSAGLSTANSFRLAYELDAELMTLVPPGQVGRILPAREARELLTRFERRAQAEDSAAAQSLAPKARAIHPKTHRPFRNGQTTLRDR
jgi:hypothetical protein